MAVSTAGLDGVFSERLTSGRYHSLAYPFAREEAHIDLSIIADAGFPESFSTGPKPRRWTAPVLQGPFLALPAEVRMNIYRYLLLPDEPWKPSRRYLPNYKTTNKSDIIHPQMVMTCKACYQEAVWLLYSKCQFSFDSPAELRTFSTAFLRKIGRMNACLIKSLDFRGLFGEANKQALVQARDENILAYIPVTDMVDTLRFCPNVEYVELDIGDVLQSQLRELGDLLKCLLERHHTLTKAINFPGNSIMSGVVAEKCWALVGKGDKLPNGKTVHGYVSCYAANL